MDRQHPGIVQRAFGLFEVRLVKVGHRDLCTFRVAQTQHHIRGQRRPL